MRARGQPTEAFFSYFDFSLSTSLVSGIHLHVTVCIYGVSLLHSLVLVRGGDEYKNQAWSLEFTLSLCALSHSQELGVA